MSGILIRWNRISRFDHSVFWVLRTISSCSFATHSQETENKLPNKLPNTDVHGHCLVLGMVHNLVEVDRHRNGGVATLASKTCLE